MILQNMKERLSHQREMSLRAVLLEDLKFLLTGLVMAIGLLIFSPLILLGIVGECEYS
jgi:hypothetical protein